MGPAVGDERPVVLDCQDLWKVYGAHSQSDLAAVLSSKEGRERQRAVLRQNGQTAAVAGVDLEVHEGELLVLMGLSGSGKSTLLRCFTRLIEPSHGRVRVNGLDLGKVSRAKMIELRRHAMGMVFQHFGLLPHLSVLDNVAFPLRVQGVDVEKRYARAREMIELVGLNGLEAQFPDQLSGGQQQRVGIARSLAVGPQIWLLDEPFSALDPLIRRQMQDEFIRLQKLLRKTIIFVTHDVQEAFRLADRIAIMRDGAIIQMGRPAEIALSPANPYIAEFLRDIPMMQTIRAADVMQPLAGDDTPAQSIRSTDLIEDILPAFLSRGSSIGVMDEEGTLIGQITVGRIAELSRRDRG